MKKIRTNKYKYKYKYKYIKKMLLLIFSIIIFSCILFLTFNIYPLFRIGYTSKEIFLINIKLDNKNINIIKKKKHINNITKIINDKNFKSNNISLYMNAFKKYGYDSSIIEIINEKYYKEASLDRYYIYYKNNKSLSKKDIVTNINCNLDYDYYSNDKDSDLLKGNLILVNKYYKLSNDYVPENLVKIDKEYGYERNINKDAYGAFKEMHEALVEEGLNIIIVSPYRSYKYQTTLYNRYVKETSKEEADTFSARAGYSEHQTGLAIDVASKDSIYTKFIYTDEYQWMLDNCYKYGFILRYPEGKESQTGYMFESWHYRYVGKKVAEYIYKNNITFDEYYEYFLNN